MKKLLVLPLLLGFSVPAIAHNETNGGCGSHCIGGSGIGERVEGEGAERWNVPEVKGAETE